MEDEVLPDPSPSPSPSAPPDEDDTIDTYEGPVKGILRVNDDLNPSD